MRALEFAECTAGNVLLDTMHFGSSVHILRLGQAASAL